MRPDNDALAEEVERLIILVDGNLRYGQVGLREEVRSLRRQLRFQAVAITLLTVICILLAVGAAGLYLAN